MDLDCEDIPSVIDAFFREESGGENGSFYSWDHCHGFLGRQENEMNRELACLHLGFFLASWGMYRGSARIRDFDYHIDRNAVDAVLDDPHPDHYDDSDHWKLHEIQATLWFSGQPPVDGSRFS